MLTQFDNELYPDDCEVVGIPSHNQFVYLIQKNGSTSLRKEARDHQLKIYKNQEIFQLSNIDVYVRPSQERYLSGINTYLQFLNRDYPELDKQTCLWFATRYNFLNRHYLPQFLWLVNLFRFMSPTAIITLRKFSDIKQITKHNRRAGVIPADITFEEQIKSMMSDDLKLWLFLDQMLEDMCGNEYTCQQLLYKIQRHPSRSYNILTQRFSEIAKKIILP